jgi:hypothetical protein
MNSFGTLSPDVITLDVLQFLKKKYPVLTTVATDFSNEPVRLNTHIISRVVVPPTVQTYTKAGGYASSSGATVDVSVSINQFQYVSLSFYDDELSSTPRNLVAEQVEAAAFSLGKDAADKLMALATPTNFPGGVVSTAANFTRDTLSAVRNKLVTQGAGPNKNGIINADAFQYLSNDPSILNKFFVGVTDQSIDIQDGVIQGIGGFNKIVEYADLSLTNTTTMGFFGSKEALVMAARVPSDPAMFISDIPINAIIKNVSDPDTGLTLQYRYHYDVKAGRLDMILTWIFGVALGVAGHGALVTSS